MKKPPTNTPDDQLLAVAHRRADRLRAVLVRKSERAGDKPTVLDAREFDGADVAGLLSWLDSQRCSDVRFVLPASSTIVRQTALPSAIASHMLAALRLQAEGVFLGSVPGNRLGLAVLAANTDDPTADRDCVMIAWPDSQSVVRDLEFTPKQEKLIRYVPEVAAMIVLAAGDLPTVAADRRAGSIAIAMRSRGAGKRGIVLRATRENVGEDAASIEAWSEGLRNAIAETALNAGVEPSRVAAIVAETEASAQQSSDGTIMLDPSIRSVLAAALEVRVPAASTDGGWWRAWATPLAAAVVATGPLADLARLRRSEDGAKTSTIEYLIRRYSDPARALRACCAATLIIGVAPIALAWVRCKVIEWKMPQASGLFEVNQGKIEHRIAQYRELGKRALPVSKLLGDLACATPDGIELESIQVSATQGVTIRGVSKAKSDTSAEKTISEMASLMDSSGVFEKTRTRWDPGDGRGMVKFDLEAPVSRPTLRPTYPELRDWALKTLAQRKFGELESENNTLNGGALNGAAASGGAGNSGAGNSAAPTTTVPATTANAAASTTAPSTNPTDGTAIADAGPDNLPGAARPSIGGPPRGIGRRDPITTITPTVPADSTTATAANPTAVAGAPTTGAGATPPPSDGRGAGSGGGPAAAALANTVIPDSFTDEELRAKTRDQARGLLADFSKAKRRPDLDAATRKRLDADFQRILDYLKSLT